VRWLGTIRYDTRSKLPRLQVPVLVMHSPADEMIGIHHGKANFAAANEPKLFWELQGDHNNPLADTQRFIAGLEKFWGMVDGT
jgi:pimeloyl-ACP methyl ester carboxylesterase